MEFAYLDESGDRGLKGSNHLVTVLLCTSKRQEIRKIIRNAKKRLLQKNKTARWLSRNGGEIKFYKFPDNVLLRKILKDLAKLDIKIYSLVFEKDKDINNNSKIFLLSQMFIHIFESSKGRIPQKIIADHAFYGKEKRYRFRLEKYITTNEITGDKDGKNIKKNIKVGFSSIPEEKYKEFKKDKMNILLTMEQADSKLHEELQALDLLCGAIFHKYEIEDSILFDIIKRRIKGLYVIRSSDIKNRKA